MPTNKKEVMLFTTLMCFLMVFGMSTYNLLLHGEFSLYALSKGLLPGFIVAFIFCLFFRGLWFDDKSQGWVVGEITPHPIYKNK